MTSTAPSQPVESGPAQQPAPQRRRPEYLGEPTLGQVMRRPLWILALLFSLLVAAVFAWLGQWQMDNAIRTDTAQLADTETVRPLAGLSTPGSGVTDAAAGMVVSVEGLLSPPDAFVVSPRENSGESGAWVVSRLQVPAADGAPAGDLAVALGWAPSIEAAERAAARFSSQTEPGLGGSFEGRYMPPEGVQVPRPDEDPQRISTMAPAQLANLWQTEEPSYAGFLVLHPVGIGADVLSDSELQAIDSVPPAPPEQVNWLNVFYAIEWIVFAGFAVFFWFRLTRDAWEKEHELKALAAESAGGDEPARSAAPDPAAETAADDPRSSRE